jgi:hypothetical protein
MRGSDEPPGKAASDVLSSRGTRTSMYIVAERREMVRPVWAVRGSDET